MIIDDQEINASRYELHPRNMTQQNIDTKKTREIRYFREPFVLTKSKWFLCATQPRQTKEELPEICIHESEEEPTDKQDIQIEVDYDNYWWSLPAHATKTIIEGMCIGRSRFLYSYTYLHKQGTWFHDGEQTATSRYAVDTSDMTHTNRDNATSRKIRFRLGPFLVTKWDWSIVDSIEQQA